YDYRESPAIDVMRILNEKGAHISYHDPFVPRIAMGTKSLESVELNPAFIRDHDCLVILTDHDTYDFSKILRWAKIVVDTRNATKGLEEFKDKIIRLGAGAVENGASHGRDEPVSVPRAHELMPDSEPLIVT
ncbi:MAG: hypothetical protein O7B35_00650, partial [Deltaproteobacteria bacterium]|nr:hypothetical protein [Deltaproteobacteria bacterium]